MIQLMKKGVVQKGGAVKDDEKFLEGINLVTGDKIDYSKHLLSQTEVTALCVNEKLSKIDKFFYILAQGEKIQKWSIFQNLTLYVDNAQSAEKIFSLIEKNYGEYEEFVNILGEGLLNFMNLTSQKPDMLNRKCYDTIYRLFHRTITSVKYQGSEVLNDWMSALTVFFHFLEDHPAVNERKAKLTELKEYINGSFSMSTLPQRRKTALQMINALVWQSQQIEAQAHTKILFFNNDLNPSTRLVICNIIEKMLKRKHHPEIWKCITDYYFTDKSGAVKDRAFQILTTVYAKSNAETIFTELASQDVKSLAVLTKYATSVCSTFQDEIRNEPDYQIKMISFLNRLLRQNMDGNMNTVLESYKILLNSIPESILVEELQLKRFNLQNPSVICELISFNNYVSHLQFKQQVKKQILKGLRFHQFDLKADHKIYKKLLDLLELSNDQEVTAFILLFSKQIDNSKWKNIQLFLAKLIEIKFYQSQYEKISACILKIYHNCPYFLLQEIHSTILHLLLNDRKNMDVFLKIKQKFTASRCWTHRRNYLKLYFYLKRNASYEFNKSIPTLVYKNILNEKNLLIKLEFVQQIQMSYSYVDPTSQQEKNSIKDTMNRMVEEKDRELAALVQSTIEHIKTTDKEYELVHLRLIRNKELFGKQQEMDQVQSQTKKHIKTEKVISKEFKDPKEKPKKGSMVETKTTLNLTKINPDKGNKNALIENRNLLRSNSTQQKQLPGMKTPMPAAKKSRF